MSKRIFQSRIKSRACENFGACDYTITDTITEVIGGGLRVETVTRGMCEGVCVDEQSTKCFEGVTLERAAAYRLANGYTEVVR